MRTRLVTFWICAILSLATARTFPVRPAYRRSRRFRSVPLALTSCSSGLEKERKERVCDSSRYGEKSAKKVSTSLIRAVSACLLRAQIVTQLIAMWAISLCQLP